VIAYRTLFGVVLDIEALPTRIARLAATLKDRVVEVLTAWEGAIDQSLDGQFSGDSRLVSANEFGRETRHVLFPRFRDTGDFEMAMFGPLGKMFRDAYYRIVILEASLKYLSKNQKEARDDRECNLREFQKQFMDRLAYDPARLLVDLYLIGWNSQNSFGEAAGLEKSTVSRLLGRLLRNNRERPGISNETFERIFAQLHSAPDVVPLLARPNVSDVDASPLVLESQRERQLLTAAASYLHDHRTDARDDLEKTLGKLYNVTGDHLELLVNATIAILTAPASRSAQSHQDDPVMYERKALLPPFPLAAN